MLALRMLAILCSTLFLLALVPTETAAVQIDSDLATTVEVDADGQYVFSIVSDGGSRLLIDGAVVIDDAATHPLGPVPSDPTFLTLGTHALEIQLVECCNGTPGVDLVLPEGVTMAELTAVPEPASVALLGLGLLCVAIICRRRVAAPAKSR
jgi:PA14 domain-containing protein/PEP-CTERM motif-containing protein